MCIRLFLVTLDWRSLKHRVFYRRSLLGALENTPALSKNARKNSLKSGMKTVLERKYTTTGSTINYFNWTCGRTIFCPTTTKASYCTSTWCTNFANSIFMFVFSRKDEHDGGSTLCCRSYGTPVACTRVRTARIEPRRKHNQPSQQQPQHKNNYYLLRVLWSERGITASPDRSWFNIFGEWARISEMESHNLVPFFCLRSRQIFSRRTQLRQWTADLSWPW